MSLRELDSEEKILLHEENTMMILVREKGEPPQDRLRESEPKLLRVGEWNCFLLASFPPREWNDPAGGGCMWIGLPPNTTQQIIALN